MSDDEYEYEYSDNDEEMGEEDQFEYTDDEEEQEETNDAAVLLENTYYNAKGLRDTSIEEATVEFEKVVELEKDQPDFSEDKQWSYKALKQLTKLHLRSGTPEAMMAYYKRMLECIVEGNISPNAVEKGVHGMLDRISLLLQQGSDGSSSSGGATKTNMANPQLVARQVYDATLAVFHPTKGNSPNERLWFKTNLKFGQLLYELFETAKLQTVLRDLTKMDISSGTNQMEIYALQIQLCWRQGELGKLKRIFDLAMSVRGGIPHPRTLALIQELGGKMHMSSKHYEAASTSFFQAFKSYDEAGDPSRLRCLKYLVMASMLHASTINPFDSQEARPYREDPEIQQMTNLVQAFQDNDIQAFERILKKGRILEDEFIAQYITDLLRTIRTQVLKKILQPYTRITLKAIAKELNGIPLAEVESLLIPLLLEAGNGLDGDIDQVEGVLYLNKAGSSAPGVGDETEEATTLALQEMADALETLSISIASTKFRDGSGGGGGPQMMRSMVH